MYRVTWDKETGGGLLNQKVVEGANIFDAPVVVVRDGVEPKELQAVDVKRMLKRNSNVMFLIESEAIE